MNIHLQDGLVEVEVGALDYGFTLQGILGLDFLLQAKAIINLDALTLT